MEYSAWELLLQWKHQVNEIFITQIALHFIDIILKKELAKILSML